MDNFEYYNPVHVVFGAGEVKRLGSETARFGKKALLVSYKEHGFMTHLLDNAVACLKEAGVEAVPFFAAVANPTMDEVRAGVELAQKENVDVIIGYGGGSVMDTAKIIAAGVEYGDDAWGMMISRHDEATSVPPESALPTIMVPTVPATSSEMNCGAVVTCNETKVKGYMMNPHLFPKVSILDPELTATLPAYQTACGAADAISHVLEVYLNGADDTPLQDRIMEGLIINLMEHAKEVLKNPNDITARGHKMWEAAVAWNGWTLPGTSSTFPMHFIAHPLSARYNLTHGATLAIVMPAWMKKTYKSHVGRYIQFGERIFGMDIEGRNPEEVAVEVISRFELFLKEAGVQTRLSECNVPEEHIDEIADDVVRTAFTADERLPARIPATRDEVRQVLELAY